MCDECLNHEDDFKNPTEDIEKIEDKNDNNTNI